MFSIRKPLKIFAIAAFWLALWQVLSIFVGKNVLLPPPFEVASRLAVLALEKSFWLSVGNSLLRILAGFVLGTVLGILLAVLTFRFPLVRSFLSPLLSVIKATPVASFIVLAFITLSAGNIPVLTATLVVLPSVWASTETGLREIDPKLLEMAKAFQIPRSRRLTTIIFPSLAPYFLAVIHSAMGMAWKAGIAAEVICPYGDSLGHRLYDAKIYMETPDLFAWTAVVILFSVLLEKLLLHFMKRKEDFHA